MNGHEITGPVKVRRQSKALGEYETFAVRCSCGWNDAMSFGEREARDRAAHHVRFAA